MNQLTHKHAVEDMFWNAFAELSLQSEGSWHAMMAE